MSVFTPLQRDELEAFLAPYRLGRLRDFQGIAAGSENSNFFISLEQGEYVLTLIERGPRQDLPFFIELLDVLHRAGLPVPYALRTEQGEALKERRHASTNGVLIVSFCLDKRGRIVSDIDIRSVGLPGVIAHGMYTLALVGRAVAEWTGGAEVVDLGAARTFIGVAGTVTTLTAGILGLDTSAYSVGYVAGWLKGDADLIRQSASRVLAAAHRIAEAIIEDPTD